MSPNEQLVLRNRNWRKNLKKFMNSVLGKYDLATIILFGSRARGEYSAFSDTDILIILEESSLETLEEIIKMAYEADLVSPEIHLFEKNWVIENFESNTVLLDAVYEGKVLVDKLNIIKELKERLDELLKSEWTKERDGWKIKRKSV